MTDIVETAGAQGDAPTWQHSYPLSGPPQSEQVMVAVQCQNMPTDGSIAFAVSGSGGEADVPRTPIAPPSFVLGVRMTWPADYSGVMTVSYWQGQTTPPPGASVQPVVTQMVTAVGAKQVSTSAGFKAE
jgi:hypothetical protein